MYNSFLRMRTTSQPINIETSSPDRYSHDRNTLGSTHERNQDSSSDEEDSHRNRNTDAHINNLSDNYSHMTVGSLPGSRRERRSAVSFMADRSAGGNDLSRSVPVPQAPFLASRRDRNTRERLNSIPSIQLPESVAESLEASSNPYGSLNESQFRVPSSSVNNQRSSTNVASSHNPSAGSGQMLDIQKKVQEMRKNDTLIKNDQGGLASLFGGGNAVLGDNEDLDINQAHDITNNAIEQERNTVEESLMPLDMNGIGSSLIEDLALNQHMQHQQSQLSHAHAQTSTSIPIQNPFASNPQNEYQTSSACESELSSSLTGLSILKQRGMVDLKPDQREAMASMRSRSFIENESSFFRSNDEGIAPTSEIPSADLSFRGMENDLLYSTLSGQSNRSDDGQEGDGDAYSQDAILDVQYKSIEEPDELFNLDM